MLMRSRLPNVSRFGRVRIEYGSLICIQPYVVVCTS